MSKNKNLTKAKKAKNDEFYTQLSDIENELQHYRHHFKDKIILCNCDNPYESNFFKYFALNFNFFGLKKLITTCYAESPFAGDELRLFEDEEKEKPINQPYKVEITEVGDINGDGAFDLLDIEQLLKFGKNTITLLKGDGDFRSEECVELLKEADIVVTNPPFSLFREYVSQLIDYNKKFIIIGNKNAIKYKEIFPLIKDNKIWLGCNSPKEFMQPDNNETKNVDGLCRWYTNLEISKRTEELTLYKRYSPEEFPRYDNYDAINVDKVADIPYDYDGVIGVPTTFIDKHNPEQFEIIGVIAACSNGKYAMSPKAIVNGKALYTRILIKKKVGD